MNRRNDFNISLESFYDQLSELNSHLRFRFNNEFNRDLPFAEVLFDRWDRAKRLGFGSATSVYDSCFVFGHVKVGKNCWIGPNSILDGSGGLEVGDFCTISNGVQIYTHDNVKATLSSSLVPIERAPVTIGHNVYVAPNTIITKGVVIGNFCVIGAMSLVNKSVPDFSIAFGQPARVVGKVIIKDSDIIFEYY